MRALVFRKLADKRPGSERVTTFTSSGEKVLVNPATGNAEPWPLLGVVIEGETPQVTQLPTSTVQRAVGEGWMVLEGERAVQRPAGPTSDPWRSAHSFLHADAIVIKCVDGDVRYRVTHQPDKYPDGETTRVDWFYELELEG